MILVTTPTGNTGRSVLASLTTPARAFVRDASKLTGYSGEIVEGDLLNAEDLERALVGVKSVFFCVPQSGESVDIPAYYRSFTKPFADACRHSEVTRIVAIGGGDGGKPFPGIGEGLAEVEELLYETGVDVRILRCGYFMENYFWSLQSIARSTFSLPVARDVPIPFVAAADIGVAAAQLLEDPTWNGQKGLAAHGPERLSCDQAASVLTDVLDFPVAFQPVSAEEYCATLVAHGVTPEMGTSLGEMFRAIADGRDMGRTDMESVECPTTLREWTGRSFVHAIRSIKNRT